MGCCLLCSGAKPLGWSERAPGRRAIGIPPLIYRPQKSTTPAGLSAVGLILRRKQNNETREISALAFQSGGYPRPHAVGRPRIRKPVFRNICAGEWLNRVVCIDLTLAMSSASKVRAKTSPSAGPRRLKHFRFRCYVFRPGFEYSATRVKGVIQYGMSFYEVPKLNESFVSAINHLRANWLTNLGVSEELDDQLSNWE